MHIIDTPVAILYTISMHAMTTTPGIRKRRQGVAIVTPQRYTTADAELIVDGIVYADDEVMLTTARCAHCGTHVELTADEHARAKVAIIEESRS